MQRVAAFGTKTIWSRAPLLVLTLIGGAQSAGAQGVEVVGVRALGMAGAWVAVADDATAIYWNPGGLATGAFASALVEHHEVREPDHAPPSIGGSIFGLGDGSSTFVGVGTLPLGVAYYRLRSSSVEGTAGQEPAIVGRTLVTDNVAITLVQSLADNFHVGGAVRIVLGGAGSGVLPGGDFDALREAAADLDRESSVGVDLDLGLMYADPAFRVGIAGRNLISPEFETGHDDEALSLEREVRLGFALFPAPGWTVAADADLTRTSSPAGDRRHVAFGAQRTLGARFAVRGGVRLNTIDDVRPAAALGVSVGLRSSVWLDAHFTRGGDDADRGWGVAFRAGL
jgi:F plasmid transfer operon, TraF, protein